MKKLNNLLNIVIGASIGTFIGGCIYQFWNYKTHPDLYAMASAPWYTSILVRGSIIAVIVIVAIIVKILIRKKIK